MPVITSTLSCFGSECAFDNYCLLPTQVNSPCLTTCTSKYNRTPHLDEKDDKETHVSILSRNLPDKPHDCVFGEKAASSRENAQDEANRRGAMVSVYVISTNRDQEERLRNLWSSIPCRFFVMRGGDFFHTNEGRYDTMGTDRLASLSGASYLHGHPALVFDGGTGTRSSLFSRCSNETITYSFKSHDVLCDQSPRPNISKCSLICHAETLVKNRSNKQHANQKRSGRGNWSRSAEQTQVHVERHRRSA